MKKTMQWIQSLLILCAALGWSGAAYALTQTLSPTTCTSVAGTGTVDWTNPAQAVSSNTSYATVSLNGTTSKYLQCTGYGFTIPSGATINGITVNVTRKSSSTANGGSADAALRLVKAGVIGATDRSNATAYTTADVIDAHGGSFDLWGTTLTATDVNDPNFGAAFASTKASGSGGAQTVSVDVVSITVNYFVCAQPANTPVGLLLQCQCDTFGRAALNPSTIFGSNWIVSTSDTTGIVPSIVNPGYLRLTNNTGNNAKAATVPGIFPAAGNYISVEFQQYAYNGSGADGIAVTLSDYSVPAVPGAFGGSLGYAQKTPPAVAANVPGFAGGWIGVALDEFGNYQNPSEGRIGGPGATVESVGVRGSGSGVAGYQWIAGTTANLNPLIDNHTSTVPSLGYSHQVIVDARNDPAITKVVVNRDTGSGYASLITIPNIYTAAAAQGFTQAPVPSNWQISFTGSTGGSTNIHEIGALKVCAQNIFPPSGGTPSGFNAVDEAYGTPSIAVQNYLSGHIFMKLVGSSFKLDVAALNNSQIQTTYAISGAKPVTVKLVDNANGACILDSTQAGYCNSACTGKTAVPGGSQTLNFSSSDAGQKQFGPFTLNTAYSNLAAIISDGTVTACSTDGFSVRPTAIASVVSTDATNSTISGTPKFKAGTDKFSMTATYNGIVGNVSGYTGTLKINNPVLPAGPATTGGTISPSSFPAATFTAPSATSVATGSSYFTYSDVGDFTLPAQGVYDGVNTSVECPAASVNAAQCDAIKLLTWSGVDSISAKNDCIVDSYSNTIVASGPDKGKYGCNFGTTSATAVIGRFIPDHFALSASSIVNRSELASCSASLFTYMGEPIQLKFTLTAQNGANGTTKNYAGQLANIDLGTPTNFHLGALDSYSGAVKQPITQITKANPGVVTTSAAHGYTTGDMILISDVQGMVQLNTYQPVPVTVIDATHFSIGDTSANSVYSAPSGVARKKIAVGIDLSSRLTFTSTGTWLSGVATDITLPVTFTRGANPDGPYMPEFGIAPVDTDGVTLPYNMDISAPAGNDHATLGVTTAVFYGRLLIPNVYGSELLTLPLTPVQAQYWTGSLYQTAILDSCSPVTAANLTVTQSKGATIYTPATVASALTGGATLVKGMVPAVSALRLKVPTASPTATGSVSVKSSTGAPAGLPLNSYLPGAGMETFGVYNSGPVIYIRELY